MGKLESFNLLLLLGCCGYGMYNLEPGTNPYWFIALCFAGIHGLLGMIENMGGGDDEDCNKIKTISAAILEVMLVSHINIEIYLKSDKSAYALVHGLYVIPLVFDFILMFTSESEDGLCTQTLKDIVVLGNIASMAFLAYNDTNNLYGGMAFAAILAKFGDFIFEKISCGLGSAGTALGQAGFVALSTMALTGGG